MPKQSEEQVAARRLARARRDALAAEESHRRQLATRQRWASESMYLTREEAAAGAHCRGCGLPVIDGLGDWGPLMKLSPEQRREHDAQEAAYAARHQGCRAHRWSMSGSRATHCGSCCPPLPLSRNQVEGIAKILDRHRQSIKHLREWTLFLTCDHQKRASRSAQDKAWSGGVADCELCGEPRGVVSATPGEEYREEPSGAADRGQGCRAR
jgi:hypothetical protein